MTSPRDIRLPARVSTAVLSWGALLVLFALATPAAVFPADVHFSPGGGIRRHLLRAIRDSRHRIDVAVYHITSFELAQALVAARDRGVRVRILTDQEKARADGRAMRIFRAASLPVRTLGVSDQSLMHHKFAVFDDRVVATGSYNWTQTAERASYENVIFLDDPALVARFAEEFQRLWRSSRE